MTSPWELLEARVRSDPANPLVTMYDDATGERVELSAVTLANWVAKTANLLVDELDVEPGETVTIDLPAHWQAFVAGLAVSAVGALEGPGGRVQLVAESRLGDAVDDALEDADAVVLSLLPMGAGRTSDGPGIDYAVEVRTHGDHFAGGPASGEGLVVAAESAAAALTPGARVLSTAPAYDLAVLLAPLLVGGSLVLVRNEDPKTRERRVESERITH